MTVSCTSSSPQLKLHERSKCRSLMDQAILMPHLLIQVVLRQIVWHFLLIHISIVVKFWFVVNFWFYSRSPISHNNQSRPQQGGRSSRVCRIRHKSAGSKRSDGATTLAHLWLCQPLAAKQTRVCFATLVTVAMDSHSHLQP